MWEYLTPVLILGIVGVLSVLLFSRLKGGT